MTIGERIREERKKQGLTQKRLGELCGIAEPTIRKYELGKLNPKYQTLQKIAGALNISISAFFPDKPLGLSLLNLALENDLNIQRSVECFLDDPDEIVNTFTDDDGFEFTESAVYKFTGIVNNFNALNASGRNEAAKRIRELTFVPEYQKKDGE